MKSLLLTVKFKGMCLENLTERIIFIEMKMGFGKYNRMIGFTYSLLLFLQEEVMALYKHRITSNEIQMDKKKEMNCYLFQK